MAKNAVPSDFSTLDLTEMTYSRISTLAVVSPICGIASSLGLFIAEVAALSLIGLATGAVALRSIRKYELFGRGAAVFGTVVSLSVLVATPIWHVAWFRSESLRGYARLDFASMTNEKQRAFESFVGENICLKGYAYPSGSPAEMFVFTSNGANRSMDN